jgi:hypothetical protein
VPFGILLSNHDSEYFKQYVHGINKECVTLFKDEYADFGTSLHGLRKSIEQKLVSVEYVEGLTRNYLSKIQLFAFEPATRNVNGENILYSHAPVTPEKIAQVALAFSVKYDASTPEALAQTIKNINHQFQSYAQSKDHLAVVLKNSVIDALINDRYKDLAKQDSTPFDFPVVNLHGHVGNEIQTVTNDSFKHVNIDGTFGKPGPHSNQGQYKICRTQSTSPLLKRRKEGLSLAATKSLDDNYTNSSSSSNSSNNTDANSSDNAAPIIIEHEIRLDEFYNKDWVTKAAYDRRLFYCVLIYSTHPIRSFTKEQKHCLDEFITSTYAVSDNQIDTTIREYYKDIQITNELSSDEKARMEEFIHAPNFIDYALNEQNTIDFFKEIKEHMFKTYPALIEAVAFYARIASLLQKLPATTQPIQINLTLPGKGEVSGNFEQFKKDIILYTGYLRKNHKNITINARAKIQPSAPQRLFSRSTSSQTSTVQAGQTAEKELRTQSLQ